MLIKRLVCVFEGGVSVSLNNKKRLDVLVFEKGLTDSREKAKAVIMAGLIYVDNQKSDKCGVLVSEEAHFELRGKTNPYVSRGGLKLEKAVNSFGVKLSDKICMDVGASTGGFTDCMLQNGALKVYSVDVGYGQLAWKLRTDQRVINLERTNIRYVTKEQIPDCLDFISIDVSFISLGLVLPVVKPFLKNDGQILALIKPQFEAGKEKVGKKGVVRDLNTHIEVVKKITELAKSLGFYVYNLSFSPIKGPEGNIEYLLHIGSGVNQTNFTDESIESVVNESHIILNREG